MARIEVVAIERFVRCMWVARTWELRDREALGFQFVGLEGRKYQSVRQETLKEEQSGAKDHDVFTDTVLVMLTLKVP